MQTRYLLLIFSFLCVVLQSSCKKDELITDSGAKLDFSTDSVLFDTVFVTIGSVTKNFKIYNNNDQPIKVSNIHLAGGNQSNFRINVNGLPGPDFSDLEIRGNDSAWVFVEVTVDPNSQLLPYIIKDSIVFETNGNTQDIDLAAWGQNAHFIVADRSLITGNNTAIRYALLDTNLNATINWDDQLPYVVYGGYAVVDSTQTLNIAEGTQVHFNNSSGLWVYKGGTLKVAGTLTKPVVFQGLRREAAFEDEPGQWDRIWINDGGNNEINYAIIKNAFIGLQTEILSNPIMDQNLKLTNTIIKNMSGLGILSRAFGVSTTSNGISGWNNVIANCGQYCAAFTLGGSYEFTNCTFANYWKNGQRGTPAVYINNYQVVNNAADPLDLRKATFNNCIIYGSNDYELEVDMVGGKDSVYNFNNLLVKSDAKHLTSNANFVSVDRNLDPKFSDTGKNNYKLESGSAALDKGNAALFPPGLLLDLNEQNRNVGAAPDLGAYEKQ